jgi:hypothetical protein
LRFVAGFTGLRKNRVFSILSSSKLDFEKKTKGYGGIGKREIGIEDHGRAGYGMEFPPI